jgi:nitrogen fixation protein FixH
MLFNASKQNVQKQEEANKASIRITNEPENTTEKTTSIVTEAEEVREINLVISQPSNNIEVATPTMTVSGKTVPNADVSVNDMELRADIQGNFSAQITLDEGENVINVVANASDGRYAEREIVVTLNSGTQTE